MAKTFAKNPCSAPCNAPRNFICIGHNIGHNNFRQQNPLIIPVLGTSGPGEGVITKGVFSLAEPRRSLESRQLSHSLLLSTIWRLSRIAIALARHKGAYWEIPGSALEVLLGVLWEIGVLWGVLSRVLRETGGAPGSAPEGAFPVEPHTLGTLKSTPWSTHPRFP